jgi:hypothetical protein
MVVQFTESFFQSLPPEYLLKFAFKDDTCSRTQGVSDRSDPDNDQDNGEYDAPLRS